MPATLIDPQGFDPTRISSRSRVVALRAQVRTVAVPARGYEAHPRRSEVMFHLAVIDFMPRRGASESPTPGVGE
ncbi:hypothetical protein [Streptomyces sp. LN785]|uniref:hypothetical protein n=1 Tax=Streptomyces sp. LN785 TaxID=3112983 RepID=UPI003723D91E